MLRRSLLALAALLLAAPALAADDDPVAFVRELYQVHAERLEKNNKPIWFAPADRSRFFTRRLAGLYERAYKRNDIGFDFIYDGQDYKISGLSFALARRAGNKATVIASFKNFDEQKRVEFDLVREGGAWRVAEMRSRLKPSWTATRVLQGR